ncbi:MAG TPA: efflux RND transporter periplasmic adaptor subunit [Longimicrobiales bacterium]|nr:efflux RND transporter periplasmic adaptor subunit [Longimicrobiales bacterium]
MSHDVKRTSGRRRGAGVTGATLTLLLAGALGACGTGEAGEAPVLTHAVVERGDLRITAEATGTVEPVRQVEVKSKASGEILRLHADVGDRVEPGTLLAEVDPRDVRNNHEQVRADLAVAQERRDIARRQLERQEELAAAGVITEQELESTRLEYANAEASLIKARTNLDLAELQLADVTIRAPLAGTILTRNVEEGTVIQSASQNVSGGTVLFVMASLEAMQVRTLVDETDMGELRAGMNATVTVEAYPDRAFAGVVEKIEPQAVVQQNVTMFPVIVRLENRSGLLKPGMNAEVEILVDEATDVLLVPNNAIVNTEDVGPAAMVLGLDYESMDLGEFRQAGRSGARPAEGATGREAAPPGSVEAEAGDASSRRRSRRAVVFVTTDTLAGPAPRLVEIGLNDWDRTQVVAGLEEGEQVALIGAAQLQARQDEFMERMRGRMGGSPFGR